MRAPSSVVSFCCRPHGSFLPACAGEILEQIITPHGIKSLPPINQLLTEPFFKVIREWGRNECGGSRSAFALLTTFLFHSST